MKKIEQYFKRFLGEENAYFDEIHKRAYSYDATKNIIYLMGFFFQEMKKILLKLKFCNENNIIVIPRGSGSGFTGGALAVNGGWCLLLKSI